MQLTSSLRINNKRNTIPRNSVLKCHQEKGVKTCFSNIETIVVSIARVALSYLGNLVMFYPLTYLLFCRSPLPAAFSLFKPSLIAIFSRRASPIPTLR